MDGAADRVLCDGARARHARPIGRHPLRLHRRGGSAGVRAQGPGPPRLRRPRRADPAAPPLHAPRPAHRARGAREPAREHRRHPPDLPRPHRARAGARPRAALRPAPALRLDSAPAGIRLGGPAPGALGRRRGPSRMGTARPAPALGLRAGGPGGPRARPAGRLLALRHRPDRQRPRLRRPDHPQQRRDRPHRGDLPLVHRGARSLGRPVRPLAVALGSGRGGVAGALQDLGVAHRPGFPGSLERAARRCHRALRHAEARGGRAARRPPRRVAARRRAAGRGHRGGALPVAGVEPALLHGGDPLRDGPAPPAPGRARVAVRLPQQHHQRSTPAGAWRRGRASTASC